MDMKQYKIRTFIFLKFLTILTCSVDCSTIISFINNEKEFDKTIFYTLVKCKISHTFDYIYMPTPL